MVVNKKWECSECSKTFNNIYNFKRHLVIHDKNGQVKCEVFILKNPATSKRVVMNDTCK